MTWLSIAELIFKVVGPGIESAITDRLIDAAEAADLPGTGSSPESEVTAFFDLAIAGCDSQIDRIVLRATKRIIVPRSAAIWHGEAGEELTRAEKDSIGL